LRHEDPLGRRGPAEEILVHTGQHYDYLLSEVFFRDLGIPAPDYHLDIGSGSHGVQTGRMLAAVEEVIAKEEPDLVLVYGDTNSTLAGALAAAKVHVPVAHVEAGLRSFDRRMPEEVNRVLTDHCSDLLFCPTATAVANLAAEGVTAGVHLTGDVMVDALQQNLPLAKERSTALIDLGLSPKGYFLATVHRASNTDDPAALRAIMDAFARLDAPVVFPVHPRTRKKFAEYGIAPAANVSVVEPLPYFDMLALLSGARAVLTDSGGVQKEAYILEVPCVTLRENTEWVALPRRGGPATRAGSTPPGSATGMQPRGSRRSSGNLNPEDKPEMHTIDVPGTKHVYGFQRNSPS